MRLYDIDTVSCTVENFFWETNTNKRVANPKKLHYINTVLPLTHKGGVVVSMKVVVVVVVVVVVATAVVVSVVTRTLALVLKFLPAVYWGNVM